MFDPDLVTIVDRDPLEAELAVPADGRTVVLTVGADGEVLATSSTTARDRERRGTTTPPDGE